MAKNQNLNLAARAKKDKFYTQLPDIENELYHYRDFFAGKSVLCNCDDPFESEFFKYFAMHFNSLRIKKLVTTSYADSPIADKEINLFPDGKTAYMTEVTELRDWNGDTAEDLQDVEFAIEHGIYKTRKLEGDARYCAGDFRSQECIALLKEADVVVTNPPFSVFREYVAQLIEYNKKFLIVGNKNAITYKEIFPLIMNNKMWIGYTPMGHNLLFEVTREYYEEFVAKGEAGSKYKINDGKIFAQSPAIWFTNLEYKKRHEPLIIFRRYSEERYPRYDNYDAIEVSKTADIPCDYAGVMGVPISFLDKYCPEQFEIIGMAKRGAGDPALKTKIYTAADYPNYSDLNAGPVIIKNGVPRNIYPRILIRKISTIGDLE